MIKVNLKINRRELADKTYGNATTVVTGEAKPLPFRCLFTFLFLWKESDIHCRL